MLKTREENSPKLVNDEDKHMSRRSTVINLLTLSLFWSHTIKASTQKWSLYHHFFCHKEPFQAWVGLNIPKKIVNFHPSRDPSKSFEVKTLQFIKLLRFSPRVWEEGTQQTSHSGLYIANLAGMGISHHARSTSAKSIIFCPWTCPKVIK